MPENDISNSVPAETRLDSPGSMLLNIFLEPIRVFNRIRMKSTWLLPFIIALIVMGISTFLVTPYAMEAQKQQILSSEKLSPEQRDQAIQQMESFKGLTSIFGAAGAVFGVAAIVFLSAGVLC